MHHGDLTDNSNTHISLDDVVLKYLILNMVKNKDKVANHRVPKDVSKIVPCKNQEDRLDGLTFVHVAICGRNN